MPAQMITESIIVEQHGKYGVKATNGVESKWYKLNSGVQAYQLQPGQSYQVSVNVGAQGGKYINSILAGAQGAPVPTTAPAPVSAPIPQPQIPIPTAPQAGTFAPAPVAVPPIPPTTTAAPINGQTAPKNGKVEGQVGMHTLDSLIQSPALAGLTSDLETWANQVKYYYDVFMQFHREKGNL